MNGVLVNGSPVKDPLILRSGDVICFGRKMIPPEFEFVFEAPSPSVSSTEPQAQELEELLREHRTKSAELQRELEEERKRNLAEAQVRRQASQSALNVAELHSELACSVCQDWLVHAATIQCSHSFCWSCIDQWLCIPKFECPVCRHEVQREPVRTRAVDVIVQKSVDRLTDDEINEYKQRVVKADASVEKGKKLHADLEKSVNDALKKGKAFYAIGTNWTKKERETFQRGVKDYTGNTRETYCKLTGLNVQWVHSADDGKLNQALHNLQLQKFVSGTEEEIRQRLLMFLRYG